MRKIIVSGASGFLGSNFIDYALAADIETVAVTSKSGVYPEIVTVNTEDFLLNGYPCSSEDVFINCLFPTNADGFRMANGLKKVYEMITMAHECGVGALINISSQSVYASKRLAPAKEEDPLCLETPYAVGKFSSEAFVNQVFSDRPHTNIRMASLLGVGYDHRIVNRMVDQALKCEQLKVIGGMQRYGFLDVRDAAAGLVKLAMSNPNTWEETYNLGRNESSSLIELVELIADVMKQYGIQIDYEVIDGLDERNSSIDCNRFMQVFDWRPRIHLRQSLTEILEEKLTGLR